MIFNFMLNAVTIIQKPFYSGDKKSKQFFVSLWGSKKKLSGMEFSQYLHIYESNNILN